jgi:hypothetical protein
VHPVRWLFGHRKLKKATSCKKEGLAAGTSRLQDLDYIAGIYNLIPFWREIYPVGKFELPEVFESMKQLPAKLSKRILLVTSPSKLKRVGEGLQGKPVVYAFSDGGWENLPGKKDLGYETAKLAWKYNVCFAAVSYQEDENRIDRRK